MSNREDLPEEPSSGQVGPVLYEGRFEGREAFRRAVRDALACAAREGWQELVFCDADFADWPLGEREVVQSLQNWAHTGRKLTMLAKTYDEVVRLHPRFVAWRKAWDHVIECRRNTRVDRLELPSVLWTPGWVLRRLDPERSLGTATSLPEPRAAVAESVKEFLRQSSLGFPATTLGL